MLEAANPRQVIIVTARDGGKDNAMSLTWHSPASFSPELYTIFLSKRRRTYEMIRESGVFAVNFLTEDMAREAIYCGTKTGRSVDKFKELGMEKEECERINCCRLRKAAAYLECKVVDELPAGDHVIVVGEILAGKDERKKRLFYAGGGFVEDSFTTTKQAIK